MPTPHSLSERYRQPAYRHATGRAGLATLSARALIGRDGRTQVEVSTGDVNADVAGTMPLEKVQLKLLDANGAALWTQNYNDVTGTAATLQLPLLNRHQPIQLQGSVRTPNAGGKNDRTGVVTIVERANLRPDVQVELALPDNVPADIPVTIMATLRELNGDVGATVTCALYVNGARVDAIAPVWIAEHDAVKCRFQRAFADGTHTVRVAAESVQPGDWDEANNSAEVTLSVLGKELRPLYGDVYFTEADATTSKHEWGTWRYNAGVPGLEYSADLYEDWTYHTQELYANLWSQGPLTGPVQAGIRIGSGGAEVISIAMPLNTMDYGGGQLGLEGWDVNWSLTGYAFDGAVFAEFYYTRGTTVYMNSGYRASRYCPPGGNTCGPWSYWTPGEYSYDYGEWLPIGSDISITLTLEGAAELYRGVARGPFTPFSSTWHNPPSCYYGCNEQHQTSTGRTFSAQLY